MHSFFFCILFNINGKGCSDGVIYSSLRKWQIANIISQGLHEISASFMPCFKFAASRFFSYDRLYSFSLILTMGELVAGDRQSKSGNGVGESVALTVSSE